MFCVRSWQEGGGGVSGVAFVIVVCRFVRPVLFCALFPWVLVHCRTLCFTRGREIHIYVLWAEQSGTALPLAVDH